MTTWPGTIASATPGGVGASADFNNHRDALNVIGGAWPTYTPTWTGSTTDPTLGASLITGDYRLLDGTGDVHINVTIGAGFTAGSGTYRFSLPAGLVPLHINSLEWMGGAMAFDTSASAGYKATAYLFSSTAISLLGDSGVWGSTAAPITWATGDRISIHLPSIPLA